MMHHNLKIEIERSNTQYVGQIELSTAGTAGRANVSADSFDGILAALKEKHDELLGTAQAFHGVGTPHHNITHPSEGLQRTVASAAPAAKPKSGKRAKPAKGKGHVASDAYNADQKARNKRTKALVEKIAKDKPRSFASE